MQLFAQRPMAMQPTLIPDDVPVYRVKEGKFYVDDRLLEEGAIIICQEEPNQEMEPLNELAKVAMLEYLEKLDKHGMEVAAKLGKAYVSTKDAFQNSMQLAKEDGRRVSVLNERREIPTLGAEKNGPVKAQEITFAPQEEIVEVKSNDRRHVNKAKGIG